MTIRRLPNDVVNRIAAFSDDLTAWRRHLHAHPETGFDCHETAAFVAARLREFGVEQEVKVLVARCCGNDTAPDGLKASLMAKLRAVRIDMDSRELKAE